MEDFLDEYCGLEMGPIRPPSEAHSLLLRVTRNCPWNQCRFCGVYKGEKFSIRPKEHVLKDISLVKQYIDELKAGYGKAYDSDDSLAYRSAVLWYRSGMKSVFLQDANSLVIKPDDMVEILRAIRTSFPETERITSYARSQTIARISDEDLKKMAEAGLNRIHIGMESACDEVLKLVKKGVDKKTHIIAGQKVKRAGIELSEYVMPGLGGNEYSRQHALETADAFNQINPDFIRFRTLAIPEHVPLYHDYQDGVFTRTNDVKMVEEILLLIENLQGITSAVKSDHIINLMPEVEGVLPRDKEKMISALQWFLALDEKEQLLFRIGRRAAIMNCRDDLSKPLLRTRVEYAIEQNGITPENVDAVVDAMIKRYIS